MNGRSIFLLLAFSLSSTLAACGGDEPTQQSSTLRLNGTYRPTQEGPISSITFSNDKDYLLVPTGCSNATCFDIGTYRFDAQTSTLFLRNGTTQRERAIALSEMKTSDAAAVLVKSIVRTADLLEPGEQLVKPGQRATNGQSQTTDGQGKTTDSQGQELAKQVGELVKTIIEAIMDLQKMKQDKEDEKKEEEAEKKEEEEKKKEDCKQGIPTQDSTQAEKDAYAARCPNGP